MKRISMVLLALSVGSIALMSDPALAQYPRNCAGTSRTPLCTGPTRPTCLKWGPCRKGSKVSQICLKSACVPN
jgi:hypothetical protein